MGERAAPRGRGAAHGGRHRDPGATAGLGRVADGAADRLFQGPNDLMVETVSQTELSDAHRIGHDDASKVHAYQLPNHVVHHLNYFEQPQTLKFIRDCLHRG